MKERYSQMDNTVKYFRVVVKVYPASVPSSFRHTSSGYPDYDLDKRIVSSIPIISEDINIMDLYEAEIGPQLDNAIKSMIKDKMMELGRKRFYARCPKPKLNKEEGET